MRLMSFCCVAISAATTAVMMPIQAMTLWAAGDACDQEKDAREHVNAGRHHRCRMDERRNGCRAFHRVRQPDVQRELGGFADRAAEDQQSGDGEEAGILEQVRERGLEIGEIDRASRRPRA